jgi:hypothetical protein
MFRSSAAILPSTLWCCCAAEPGITALLAAAAHSQGDVLPPWHLHAAVVAGCGLHRRHMQEHALHDSTTQSSRADKGCVNGRIGMLMDVATVLLVLSVCCCCPYSLQAMWGSQAAAEHCCVGHVCAAPGGSMAGAAASQDHSMCAHHQWLGRTCTDMTQQSKTWYSTLHPEGICMGCPAAAHSMCCCSFFAGWQCATLQLLHGKDRWPALRGC